MDTRRVQARDAAARRLRRLTAAFVAGCGAVALLFAFVAAKAFPGRSQHPAARPKAVRHATPRRTPKPAAQTAPPLVQLGSQAQPSPTPASPSPSPAPAPTAAPPAVVSGGS
ncbi:MAG TPA: hypothetical protein VFL60_11250 [Gaiellaceae bacterium]|nr:hypothetical protein [Gaiellaceae bacterium]